MLRSRVKVFTIQSFNIEDCDPARRRGSRRGISATLARLKMTKLRQNDTRVW
jgi:hypothetical protein